jgi:hypothetical protein
MVFPDRFEENCLSWLHRCSNRVERRLPEEIGDGQPRRLAPQVLTRGTRPTSRERQRALILVPLPQDAQLVENVGLEIPRVLHYKLPGGTHPETTGESRGSSSECQCYSGIPILIGEWLAVHQPPRGAPPANPKGLVKTGIPGNPRALGGPRQGR